MKLTPAQILIELDPGTGPVAGRVRTGAHGDISFTGWTGLFATLRAVTSADARRSDGTAGGATEGNGMQG